MEQTRYLSKLPEKASSSTLFFYSIGFAPSAVLCYNAFYIYYMYFMTDIAHISAVVAGWISLGAIAWDAVSDPIIAHASDKCRWKSGRRIPFMTIGVVLMSVSLVAIFTALDISPAMKAVYFMFATIVFWTGATMWDIPHNALGAELVSKQQQREKLRIGTTIVDGIGLMFVVYVIPNMSDYLIQTTGDEPKAWQLTMVIIGALALCIGLTVCYILKTREPLIDWEKHDEAMKGEQADKLRVVIKELFQLRPYKYLTTLVVTVNCGNVCMQSAIVYFMTYISGFTPQQQAIVLVIHYASHLACGLLIGAGLQKRFGSRKIFIAGLATSVFASLVFPNFLNANSMVIMCIYAVLQAVGVRVLWLYCYIYAYGVSMLDDIKNTKHREGNVVGFMSLGLKMGAAIATWLIGYILQTYGYDGTLSVQSAEALTGVRILIGALPVLFIGIGLLLMIKYPMTDKDTRNIEEAIEKRNAGLPYSTEEFAHLM